MADRHKGKAVSGGLALGQILVDREYDLKNTAAEDPGTEQARLEMAREKTLRELECLETGLREQGRQEEADILGVHCLMVEDEDIFDQILSGIREEGLEAGYSLTRVLDERIRQFEAMENAYMRERAGDLKDLRRRLLKNLSPGTGPDPSGGGDKILLVTELLPAMVLDARESQIKGFLSRKGGETSHAAILARSFRLPVISVPDGYTPPEDGETVFLDGQTGEILSSLSPEDLQECSRRIRERKQYLELLEGQKDLPAVTLDGFRVELGANIISPEETASALEMGAEGIGLFRTEFLYMDASTLPDEDTQYRSYRRVLETMKGNPVIIRTLDAGGDKKPPCLPIPPEDNPYMGWRAIRICLADPALFDTQLRALLRSSRFGNLKIMLPMIVSPEEITETRQRLERLRQELERSGEQVGAFQLGIMVETPASVLILPRLLRHAEFVSIGTNDLTQYVLAADRGNRLLERYHDPGHPAVLEAIRQVAGICRENGTWVGVCGEMAGNPRYIPFLVGCGVNELSVSPSRLGEVKQVIRNLTMSGCREIVREALETES